MTAWDPAQYRRFATHRLRPAIDLINAIPLEHPAAVVDLGCGEGRVTKLLAERWPAADILGVDSSESMLSAAGGESIPRVTWIRADIGTWRPESPVDLLFSN